MLDVYKTSGAKRQFLRGLVKTIPGSTTAAQLKRLMEALRQYPISSAEAQRWLGVYDPAARVWQLRHRYGHEVATCWWRGESESGTLHKIGLYSLLREAKPAKEGSK